MVKQSKILYLHGFLLYGALRKYLLDHPEIQSLNILETGTARGFGTVCMAKALKDARRAGKIASIDILPSQKPIYWNCIHDVDGPKTRFQLLDRWQDLVEEFGYGHAYESLKRCVRKLKGQRRVVTVLHSAPGEEAQVDFFRGVSTFDSRTGQWKRPWVFG